MKLLVPESSTILSKIFRGIRKRYAPPQPCLLFSNRPSSFYSGGRQKQDEFLNASTGGYIEDMHESWKRDPKSVHASWRSYFASVEVGRSSLDSFASVPVLERSAPPPQASPSASSRAALQAIEDHMKVQLLIRAYQVRGHLRAKIDPLQIMQPDRDWSPAPELEYKYYGFGEADLEKSFRLGAGVLPALRKDGEEERLTLRQIVQTLDQIYCSSIGYEYSHVPDRQKCDWLRARIEVKTPYTFSRAQKETILDRLTWAELFEKFVASKFPGEKRFGLEGGESLIPGLKALIDVVVDGPAPSGGMRELVMGMAHRGRLNVLANVVRKPIESIFSEFSGVVNGHSGHSGDVKYHLGMNYERTSSGGNHLKISLVANPSHLEAVNPVCLGKVRGLQQGFGDLDQKEAMAVLIHGDAAFSGQGVVWESLGLSELPNYSTGGTVHVIINNQIGFTTDPRFSRSSPYCSDIAKTINAPIFHVNGDDVEAVVHAFTLAAHWRSRWKSDVVVDLVCFRRYGHNEVDQPMFTQPRMYKAIAGKPSTLSLYARTLKEKEGWGEEEIEAVRARIWATLSDYWKASKDYKPTIKEWLTSNWHGFWSPKQLREQIAPGRATGVEMDKLRSLGLAGCRLPGEGGGAVVESPDDHYHPPNIQLDPKLPFKAHPGILKILAARNRCIQEGKGIDMATAEAMAFATLLSDGTHVRLSGQDVERGTFSQRHAVIQDQLQERSWTPLAHCHPGQATFTVCNSSLSEFGVLGFELGYSLVSPHYLVLWEAQFGDFANGAQVTIDQFIASGERKWLQRSGLTLLLPHGYDGAGPEHSNARVERFLSLCDDDPYHPVPSDIDDTRTRQAQDCNLQVVYPSTPANYFHVLRRQVCRDFRKPLVCLNSKSLMRHPMATSSLQEMKQGTRFQKLYPSQEYPVEAGQGGTDAERIIFCSGQVYYALLKALRANKIKKVAICRIEQLSPFPFHQFARECDRHPAATTLVWCQEEPINLGMWAYVEPRIENCLLKMSKHHAGKRAKYAGRAPTAAVASGYKSQHIQEEYELLGDALLGSKEIVPKKVEIGVPIW